VAALKQGTRNPESGNGMMETEMETEMEYGNGICEE